MRSVLLKIAEKNGVKPTKYFDRVLKAKQRFGFTLQCPCDKDNKERFCISKLCMSDIERDGTCHCNCWEK